MLRKLSKKSSKKDKDRDKDGGGGGDGIEKRRGSSLKKHRHSTTDIPSSPVHTDMNYNLLDMTDRVPSDEMDLIHFVIGHGILRRDLRLVEGENGIRDRCRGEGGGGYGI